MAGFNINYCYALCFCVTLDDAACIRCTSIIHQSFSSLRACSKVKSYLPAKPNNISHQRRLLSVLELSKKNLSTLGTLEKPLEVQFRERAPPPGRYSAANTTSRKVFQKFTKISFCGSLSRPEQS